ncbi:MAG: oxidoreductase [Lentisphaerae bacterium RIFOXYB12_FULL_65_16]|nr:MAG: oxidoreductase [Lentisphaerae bacterium RIFOXYA12_64_32]OGV92991.1 MAG: oxidoreductase [Lentisphaerae bacterium RIFOXYB12_FULL_65_16]
MSKPVSLLVIGAGGRGAGYARYATEFPQEATVVGVAEPRDVYRERLVQTHTIPKENVFKDWRDAAARERFADAVLICTQDAMHADPAVAFAAKGYHMLLEKPMAPNETDCRRIVAAVKKADVLFAVCHVMRYTKYTHELKALLDAKAVGEVVSIQHLEPVGYWHQAHSFVRGNWRNEAESSPMLLAKSCHDLDWLRYMVGKPCRKVTSFGNLKHFRKEQKPAGAADRCLDCGVDASCPYSAKKIYLGRVAKGHNGWPVDVLTPVVSEQTVTEALRTGPYGRCVYACDNDVVDHQVVNLLFEGGATAAFTMTAFTGSGHRKTRIFGTRGEIVGDGETIRVTDFLTDQTRKVDTTKADASILGGHGGGDFGLMQSFVRALHTGDRSLILSGPDETLETHLMVFAAESARRQNRVADVVV